MKITISREGFRIGLLAIGALVIGFLPGCFNNIASTESVSRSVQGQGGVLDDSGYSSEVGDLVVDASLNSALIGHYLDPTNSSRIGIMIDLRRAIVGTIGEGALQSILENIDTNINVQSRKLIVRMPQFGIKATTTLGRVALGNSQRLRSIMNIRPGFQRVDFSTYGGNIQLPESPSLLQLTNTNTTVMSYGGKIEGAFYRMITVLINFAGQNSGFLPSTSAPTYGDGYPSGAPVEKVGSVRLMRVTQPMAVAFNKILTAPQDASRFASVPETIRNISQTYGNLALAVHKKMTPAGTVETVGGVQQIEAAYLININPGATSGPEYFPYCHSAYNGQDLPILLGATSQTSHEYVHPLACNCDPAVVTTCQLTPVPAQAPGASVFVETWPATVAQQKPSLIADAERLSPLPPALPMIIIPPSSPVTDVLFERNN